MKGRPKSSSVCLLRRALLGSQSSIGRSKAMANLLAHIKHLLQSSVHNLQSVSVETEHGLPADLIETIKAYIRSANQALDCPELTGAESSGVSTWPSISTAVGRLQLKHCLDLILTNVSNSRQQFRDGCVGLIATIKELLKDLSIKYTDLNEGFRDPSDDSSERSFSSNE